MKKRPLKPVKTLIKCLKITNQNSAQVSPRFMSYDKNEFQ